MAGRYIRIKRLGRCDTADNLAVKTGACESDSHMVQPELDSLVVSKVRFEADPVLVDSVKTHTIPS